MWAYRYVIQTNTERQVVYEEVVVTETVVETVIDTVYERRDIVDVVDYHWFQFVATGYSANDPEQGTTNTNAMGETPVWGTVAVDPLIITLGALLEILHYGVFEAQDTGGAIKGNRIDIYFEDKLDAQFFGTRDIWLRILTVEEARRYHEEAGQDEWSPENIYAFPGTGEGR